MKVLHCCLAAFYIDNFGYQENILPKIHKIQGHDVRIIASTETYMNNQCLGYVEQCSYVNEYGIPVDRIPYLKYIPQKTAVKLRLYEGLYEHIVNFKPDIIFIHDVQFLDIFHIVKYAKKNKVKIFIDGHTDFVNSARTWVSKNILHRLIYKRCAKAIEPYVEKFFGTLPLRESFFIDFYNISADKVDLLPFGVDDTIVDFNQRQLIRASFRKKYGINDDDFVVVSGGKIDSRKNILNLLRVFNKINIKNIKLLVFGDPVDSLRGEFMALADSSSIINIGWISPDKANDCFLASDLACFPGTHSVLWEQAVGLGIPCIFKSWDGIRHVDVGGNCMFLDTGTEEQIKFLILKIHEDITLFENLKNNAMKARENFLYTNIANKAIGYD